MSARFDYWEAAWKTSMTHPLKGTGPGTFKHAYSTLKRPDSEMARLAHNDYLEQASDSGFPGMFLYLGIFPFFLWRNRPKKTSSSLAVAVWFGLFGWAAQGLAEFGLYIPAMAYPAFSLLGWLDGQNTSIGRANESTKV